MAQIFLQWVKPPATPMSGPDVVDTGRFDVFAELPDGEVALPCCHRYAGFFGDFPEGEDGVGGDRIFEEVGSELFKFLGEDDGFAGDHVAVDLDADVHVPSDGISDGGHAVDEILDSLAVPHRGVVVLV